MGISSFEQNSLPNAAIEAFCPQQYSLLLVDDDEDQLDHFKALLGQHGFRIFTCTSPMDALEMLRRIYIDIIISDLNMPEMTGFDFIEQLRKIKLIPQGSRLPLIMLSSCHESFEVKALEIGADLFCPKQKAEENLVKQIRFLLGDLPA